MKKAILLLVGAALATGAQAQLQRSSSMVKTGAGEASLVPLSKTIATNPVFARHNHTTAAKGAQTAFYTQSFAGGIPAGWSTASLTTGVPSMWRWANAAPTMNASNPYPIAAIASTTAANGWMLCNPDSIGVAFPNAAPVESILTSAPINCSGHPSVQIGFQEYFRRFVDSCFIDVSNNGGTTYTSFPVNVNNSTPTNSFAGPNPTTIYMNISSVAANQASVTIRFRYKYIQAGGAYNWDVDDMTLAELDPTEVGIESSGVVFTQGTRAAGTFATARSMPIQLVDSVFPVTYLSNLGANAQTSVPVSVKIYDPSNALVYSQTQTYASLVTSASDSLIIFPNTPSYKPTVVGRYTVAFSVNQAGDALATNNIDTSYFFITDTVYNAYGFKSAGGYIIHSAPNGSTPERSFTQGILVEVPGGKKDTITSISINLNSGSTVGAKIQGQLYKFDGTGWAPRGRTVLHTIASGDLSTTATVFTNLLFAPAGTNIAPFVLDSGSYAVIVGAIGATTNQVVTVNAASNTFTNVFDFIGSTGVSDSSSNTNSYDFGAAGLPSGLGTVPIMSANFGNPARTILLNVGNIAGVTIGMTFPNPSNTSVNIPVTVKDATAVTITLSNVMGQTVRTHDMGTINAGNTNIAAISTSDLANGVYIYTINANGERAAGRIVVSH